MTHDSTPTPLTHPQLIDAFLRVGRQQSDATIVYHQAAASLLGLNATDTKACSIIEASGPMTAGQLTDKLRLTAGATTGVIDRLEQAGFIRRVPGAKDRRKVLVEINSNGFLQARTVYESMAAAIAQLAAQYSIAELTTIIDFLQKSSAVLRDEAAKLRDHQINGTDATS